jgi:hypothetical protein
VPDPNAAPETSDSGDSAQAPQVEPPADGSF